jgi:hypothetical protein
MQASFCQHSPCFPKQFETILMIYLGKPAHNSRSILKFSFCAQKYILRPKSRFYKKNRTRQHKTGLSANPSLPMIFARQPRSEARVAGAILLAMAVFNKSTSAQTLPPLVRVLHISGAGGSTLCWLARHASQNPASGVYLTQYQLGHNCNINGTGA